MPNSVFTFGVFVRQDQYNYYPSGNPFADFTPDLQSEPVGQNRSLKNAGARTNLFLGQSRTQHKSREPRTSTPFITERDTFGLVDPTANALV